MRFVWLSYGWMEKVFSIYERIGETRRPLSLNKHTIKSLPSITIFELFNTLFLTKNYDLHPLYKQKDKNNKKRCDSESTHIQYGTRFICLYTNKYCSLNTYIPHLSHHHHRHRPHPHHGRYLYMLI